MSFLKKIFPAERLVNHKSALKIFINLLILYKCKYLINLCNTGQIVKSENYAKIIRNYITVLINDFDEFLALITEEKPYSEKMNKFFTASSFELN
jgi:hypothetical protein